MLGQKVLPAILILSPASIALLSVQTTVVEAASNECKAKPDSAAPAGSRWYYRVSRVDQSRCWFLSSRDVSVHSRLSQTAPVTRSHVITPTSEAPVTQQDRQIGPQIASAIEPAEEQLAFGADDYSADGRVSRVSPVHTAIRNCTRDEGGPFEVGNQVLISSHRKLLLSKAMVVSVAETAGRDPVRQG